MTTTHSVADNALLDKLQWRYATKKMNPAKVVPQDKVDRIVEAARLAPTSSVCVRPTHLEPG
jgi:nitroreductase